MAELRLGPLSRGEVAEQVTGLVGATPPDQLVEEVYARAEGHPFFTEQLVAAAVADSGGLPGSVVLPARLSELLISRAARCGTDSRVVLSALAVAGRPLTEVHAGRGHRPGPGHGASGGAGVDGGPAAGRPEPTGGIGLGTRCWPRLVARRAAARRAGRATRAGGAGASRRRGARRWPRRRPATGRRLAGLARSCRHGSPRPRPPSRCSPTPTRQHTGSGRSSSARPNPARTSVSGIDVPHLYIRAVDALEASGDRARAWAVAEEAYRRFADHPDPATAAIIHLRAAQHLRVIDSPGRRTPPDRGGAAAVRGHTAFGRSRCGLVLVRERLLAARRGTSARRRSRLRSIAHSRWPRRPAAATLIPRILCRLAYQSFVSRRSRGRIPAARPSAERAGGFRDASAVLWLAITESDALLKVGRLEDATTHGAARLRGRPAARLRERFGADGPHCQRRRGPAWVAAAPRRQQH